jgi:AcrR family transcriptional regulator
MAAEPNPSRRAPGAGPAKPARGRQALKAVPDAPGPDTGGDTRRRERPHERPGTVAREQSRQRQRLRLALAMIECVSKDGYGATRVADVIAQAGVSRKTFYEHFANKQDCLLATYDLISNEAMRHVEVAYREAQGWPGRVESAIGALFEAALANPGALRLSLIEIAAVGPAGIERRERSLERFENVIRDGLELAPGGGVVSDVTLKALVGGLSRVLYRRVARIDDEELRALVPDLAKWATSYYPTPAALLDEPLPLSNRRRAAIRVQGGRAPGTLAPHSLLGGRRGLPRGDQNVSKSFVVQNQRARILDAVTNLTARDGYAALKVEGIAEQAAVSLVAFYEHFVDKEDAFLVAYEVGHGKALAAVERAYVAESDWRLAVRAGIDALFGFLASEPSFAHIGLIDALIATRHTAERSNDGVNAFAQMLVPGLEQTRGYMPAAITVEAIAGGIFDLCLHYALAGKIRELPELVPSATYVALAPFLGGEEAARIATASTPARHASAPTGGGA